MRRLFVFSLVLVLAVPAPVSGSPPPRRLSDCILQQVHAPFPRTIVDQSMPEGFQPLPYGPLPTSLMADTATTAIACSGDVVEEWSWIPALPPERLRSEGVDSYGVFIHAYAAVRPSPSSPRRCLSVIFEEPDEITMETTQDVMTEMHLVASKDDYLDEVWSRGNERAELPARRVRLFGRDFRGRLKSFDVVVDAPDAVVGSGYFVQRSGTPWVKGNTFAIGGYFAGHAWMVEDAALRFVAAGPSRCR